MELESIQLNRSRQIRDSAIFKQNRWDESIQKIWEEIVAPFSNPASWIGYQQLISRYFVSDQPEESIDPDKIKRIAQEIIPYQGKGLESIQRQESNSGFIFSEQMARSSEDQSKLKLLRSLLEGDPLPDPGMELLFRISTSKNISALSTCNLREGEVFLLPQKIGGSWKKIHYKVDKKFALTPSWFSHPIPAYGLVSEEGPPLLIFMGTSFSSEKGGIATLLTNFTPGLSVGSLAYYCGKSGLDEWLKDKIGVRLFGHSLGGALCFHALRDHAEQIGSVDVFNAPGLYPWNWGNSTIWPEVNIYNQINDPVPTVGYFPVGKNVSVYRILGDQVDYPWTAHVRPCVRDDNVLVVQTSAPYENGRLTRKLLTLLHILLGPILIFCPLLALYGLYRLIYLLKDGLAKGMEWLADALDRLYHWISDQQMAAAETLA